MNNQLTIEQRRARIEKWAKVAGLAVIGFLFAPFAAATITGLISLLVVGGIGLLAVNVGIPWFAVTLANWRLKALKAAAAANPIETLENTYAQKESALLKTRDNIKETYAIVQELWNQIQDHNKRFPNSPSQFQEKYEKLKALVALRADKYKAAQKNLAAFAELIEEKRSDWKIAQSMAKADKLAQVGEDFTTKLMSDTALTTIQDGLNFAFSELEVSLLDEQVAQDKAAGTTVVVASVTPKQLPARSSAPPKLDLVFDDAEPVAVSNNRQKIATT